MTDSSESRGSERNEDQLTDHSYDGIKEYDNPMPRWWVIIFWGTFVYSLAYLFHYWAGNGQSTVENYEDEMEVQNAERAREAMAQEVSEESLLQVMNDGNSIDMGRDVFAGKCVACHMEKGQGSIGPNLTDNHWIHGRGTLLDIYSTVSEGIPAKGMPAWSRQLSPTELRQVVAYVGTLRGSNVEGKPPEGEPIE